MKIEQIVSQRDRDLNTRNQFLRALGISAVIHLTLILLVLLGASMSSQQKILVPGYRVSLVMAPKPSTLQKKPTPEKKKKKRKQKKKKKRVVKKAPKNVKVKKARPKTKRKRPPKGKKIVPKKKETVKPTKEMPIEEVKAPEVVPPEKPVKKAVKKAGAAAGMPFPHLWYLKLVERKVDGNWATHGIDLGGMRGDPLVRFTITRNGSLSSVLMEKSSGSPALDESAVQAVRESSPFPPLPDDFPSDTLDVHFGFSYAQHE